MSDDSDLLTTREAATYLNVSWRTLETWRRTGGGPKYVRIGARQVRYRRRDLEVWLESQTFDHTNQESS